MIIWIGIGQVIRWQNHIKFSETPCTSQMVFNSLKHTVYKGKERGKLKTQTMIFSWKK